LHSHAGWHALDTGDIPAARAHLEAAAHAAQQIGYEDTLIPVGIGLALRAEGDLDSARSAFEAALRIGRRTGNSKGMAGAILYLACLAGDAGDWNRSYAARRRAGLSGPDEHAVGGARHALPPGQPRPSPRAPGQ
jgi:tetratricopeptide (TPR) repeat protein